MKRFISSRGTELPHDEICQLRTPDPLVPKATDVAPENKLSTEELGAALREGIRLVESLFNELHHDETSCHCETCTWVRNAEHLTEEVEHHLPHVDPAVVAAPREDA